MTKKDSLAGNTMNEQPMDKNKFTESESAIIIDLLDQRETHIAETVGQHYTEMEFAAFKIQAVSIRTKLNEKPGVSRCSHGTGLLPCPLLCDEWRLAKAERLAKRNSHK